MINQTLPRILAFAPKSLEGIGVVAAACRASALGIVDLCSEHARRDVAEAFRQISRLTDAPFGVRVEAKDVLQASWLADASVSLRVVCVPVRSGDEPSFRDGGTGDSRDRPAGPGGSDVESRDTSGDRGRGRRADRRRQRGGRLGRSRVFVRALAGGACRGESAGLGSRWGWAQCRGGLRGGGSGGRRS